MSDCASACCNLSQCDLAWMLERHCYIVNCQHKENCEPKKMQTMTSHLIFVLRPPDRLLPFVGYGTLGASRGRAAGMQADPAEDVGNLKGLSLLTKYHNPEELNDYNDDYMDHEQDPILPSTKQDWKESLDYADWFPTSSEKSFNLSEADPRGRNVHSAEVQKKETKWEQVMVKNGSELAAVTLPAEKLLSYTMSKLLFATVPPSANDLQPQPLKANGSFLEEVLRSSNNQSQITEILPTGAKMLKNLQGDLSIPQSGTVTALPSSAPTPPSTAAREISAHTATAPAVKPLVVSAGGDIQIMLPKNEVELNAFVLPAPAAGRVRH